MNQVHIKKERGISIITLVISAIVIIMVMSAVIITLVRQKTVTNTYEATVKLDLQSMSDEYDIVYQKALYSVDGDHKKVSDVEFYDVVQSKYLGEYVATKNGIVYLGNNRNIISYIGHFNNIIPLESKHNNEKILISDIESDTNSINFSIFVNDKFNEGFRYIYAYRSIEEKIWNVYSSDSYKVTIENLKSGTSYFIKVLAKEGNEYYVSKSYTVVTNKDN